jgi:hypothetical protein
MQDEFLKAISTHSEDSERLSQLDDLAMHFSALNKSLAELPEHKGAHFRTTAERYVTTLQGFMFVALVCRRKIDAINEILKFAHQSGNALALAQGIRSLVEHVAVQAEIAKVLEHLNESIKGQTDGEKIHLILRKAEIFVNRCYFGKSPKTTSDKEKQALHVNDCLKTLESDFIGVGEAYDFLCEFVHPNHGSNALVSIKDHRTLITSIVSDLDRPDTRDMLGIAISAFQVSEKIELKIHSNVGYLGGFANRFFLAKAKVSNVFSPKDIKPTGDGKTKETALFFPNARDHVEIYDLLYKFMKARRIEVGERVLDGIDGNFLFETFDSSIGVVWHKVEIPGSEGDESDRQ